LAVWGRTVVAGERNGIIRFMEAKYRIISQADATSATAKTEPGKPPIITGQFKAEEEARAHGANLKKQPPDTD
jgi:hypothetical protein